MNPVLKLSLIRWVGDKAKPEDRERCVADGVDVLQRLEVKTTGKFKTNTIVDYFLEHNLKLLTSDKAGGFVVLPEALYKTKAKEAIQKNFKPLCYAPCDTYSSPKEQLDVAFQKDFPAGDNIGDDGHKNTRPRRQVHVVVRVEPAQPELSVKASAIDMVGFPQW
ncbi:hypothetical protein HPB47_009257 [Ixodes persulcatus]|uniref:Uncharacterized protein n=1 Tax=Ixodes persulcatus TaxID=34615 RepID=A0AC60P2I8_IXOPE|nr:hypothetical protein HPB47_009257 [Ixodes persulcatus]